LALDLSLTATGWASWVVQDTQPGAPVAATTSSGVLAVNGYKGMRRLDAILTQVAQLLRTGLGSAPTIKGLVLIENYSYGSANQAHQLGELGGIVRHWLWENSVPWLAVPPMLIKKYTTGRGNAKKELMMMNVLDRWDMRCEDNNQADAVALLMLGRALVGCSPENLTKFQQEAVNEVLKSYITNKEK
jgi:crossover junction endodeoxyribonuclease RuvC